MNVIDVERGLIGCFGIVGGSIAAATGAGLAAQLSRDGSVAVAFFGDGASNQAYFHECLNLAAVRGLLFDLALTGDRAAADAGMRLLGERFGLTATPSPVEV